MPVVDGQPVPSEPPVVVEPSVAVEIEWVMDSAMHPNWRAEHPDLDAIYGRHPELIPELTGLWGPDRATSCGGFLELTVLAQVAGELFGTDSHTVLAALPEAMALAPTDVRHFPLYSETDDDRRVVLSRLAALRRSKSLRQRYLEAVHHAWEAAQPAWEVRGTASVQRAVERRRRQAQSGAPWQEVAENSCFSEHLPVTVDAVGPSAQVAVVPSYFAHKGLFVDLEHQVLVSVRSEPMAAAGRARTTSLARQLKTLSDPTRLAILDALRRSPRTVGELADAFALAQPTVSNHVKVLRQAGLVTDVRNGRRRDLQVLPAALSELVGELQDTLGTEVPGAQT